MRHGNKFVKLGRKTLAEHKIEAQRRQAKFDREELAAPIWVPMGNGTGFWFSADAVELKPLLPIPLGTYGNPDLRPGPLKPIDDPYL